MGLRLGENGRDGASHNACVVARLSKVRDDEAKISNKGKCEMTQRERSSSKRRSDEAGERSPRGGRELSEIRDDEGIDMRLIDADAIKDFYLNSFDFGEREIRFSKNDVINNLDCIPTAAETILVRSNVYDKETIYENCTVQVWENSVTGEVSVGWWQNEKTEQ